MEPTLVQMYKFVTESPVFFEIINKDLAVFLQDHSWTFYKPD